MAMYKCLANLRVTKCRVGAKPTASVDEAHVDLDSPIWAPKSATDLARLESDPTMVFVEGEPAGFRRMAPPL
jgi:hypothetical protein